MNTHNVIALDVDDVCLSLMESWLELYNEEFNDDGIRPEGIVLSSDYSVYS